MGRILQALYPTPRAESKRVITFANRDDFISFRHHMYSMEAGKVKLAEAGPRFEMQPYEARYKFCMIFLLSPLIAELILLLLLLFYSRNLIFTFFCEDSTRNSGPRRSRKRVGFEAVYEYC